MSRVIVAGSFVVDLVCRTPHLPERGETVLAGPFSMGAGGKGLNQAVAAARAGADTSFIGKVGGDDFATLVYEALDRAGILVKSRIFCDRNLRTGVALIMVESAGAENIITVAPGASAALSRDEIGEALDGMAVGAGDILLTQFETNEAVVGEVLARAKRAGGRVIVNPAPAGALPGDRGAEGAGIDFLTPNETELSALSGLSVNSASDVLAADRALRNMGFSGTLLATMGGEGIVIVSPDLKKHIPAWPVDPIDTTGAGDAFNGTFAAALSEGKDVVEAALFASAAAAISVTRMGTSSAMPSRSEILAFMAKAPIPEAKVIHD